ncbi:MAG: dephospho-CoA kinase [Candidatus Liberibacter ctenarytainae]|uniref:Dephospho-CoA kinase n=1 Tax=Candidatus Liberibacter ctenarytainae TaxID=2020335 RepID=A0A937AJR2_9HYPH|nr:dephospho-CoA kinase [Candidatus Liberibacter ctenarytainae]
MLIIGLTGSIGTGKTTVAGLLRKEKIPVISSDDIVNQLYQHEAVDIIGKNFPRSIQNGKVDKKFLLEELKKSPKKIDVLEKIVHPMVRIYEQKILNELLHRGEKMVFFDTPLIFEKNKVSFFDAIVVVTCSFETQFQRVLSRKKHTKESFLFILSNQMSDKEKISRADYIIDTEDPIEKIEIEIRKILMHIYKTRDSDRKNA